MAKIEKSLLLLDAVSRGGTEGVADIDSRASLLTVVVYLCMMLSVPATHIDLLIWFALFPIIASPLYGLSYSRIFLQSLIVLPLVILIGFFNPIVDRTPVAYFGGVAITRGWLLFIGVVIRGLLSMQVLLILIHSIGFTGMVRAMGRLGVPRFLTTQLLMVFRYIRVLVEEGITMKAARDARSYGNRRLSLRQWGVLTGQLFLRSVERAERIHRAMLSRGFTGEIPSYTSCNSRWTPVSTLFLAGWSGVFVFLRLYNLSLLFVR